MHRRGFLAALAPALGLGAGCTKGGGGQPTSEENLWSVSSGDVDLDRFDFTVHATHETATMVEPAKIRLKFTNPTSHTLTLYEGACSKPASGDGGLILFASSLPESNHPDPIRQGCWKPDPESYYYPCEGASSQVDLSPGESWSVVHEIWIAEDFDCIPEGTFVFTVRGNDPSVDSSGSTFSGTFTIHITRGES